MKTVSLAALLAAYDETHSVRGTARKCGISHTRARRMLLDKEVHITPRTAAIRKLMEIGMDVDQVAAAFEVRPGTIRNYLPYKKGAYMVEETRTVNAQRVEQSRDRKKAGE